MEGWVAFLYTSGGITLGWLLSQFGGWLKTQEEHKRIYRHVLFQLLELYYMFRKMEEMDIEALADRVISRFPAEARAVVSGPELVRNIRSSMDAHIRDAVIPAIQAIGSNYNAALVALSHIDPMTAYVLKGRTELMDELDRMARLIAPGDQALGATLDAEYTAELIQKVARPHMFTKGLAQTRSDILSLAWRCGAYQWWIVRRSPLMSKEPIHVEVAADIDAFVDELLDAAKTMKDGAASGEGVG